MSNPISRNGLAQTSALPSQTVQVALPVPLRREFDYRLPDPGGRPCIGARVRVPFGRRQLVGVITGQKESTFEASRIKPIDSVLDSQAVMSDTAFKLARWVAGYYHHPIGEVIAAMLPATLRKGDPLAAESVPAWQLTQQGQDASLDDLKRAPVQQLLLKALQASIEPVTADYLRLHANGWRRAINALTERALVEQTVTDASVPVAPDGEGETGPELNESQLHAVQTIVNSLGGFKPFLLFGVTGSGKTEVYIHAIQRVLEQGQQVLVLVPEIGLTPQLIERFTARLNVPVAVMHSAMSDANRYRAWWQAREGHSQVVIGTRSAVFTPMQRLGLIVIDEEHDGAFKQQDGLRYNARDVAVTRAHYEQVPIVLGSATPSLESMANVDRKRYTRLDLPERTGLAQLPTVHIIDTRQSPLVEGVTRSLFDAIEHRLQNNQQSLVFINRRGFSPVLMCTGCGWQALCERCDARMTLHKQRESLQCHHCGAHQPIPKACVQCDSEIVPVGEGTQRIETYLEQSFPNATLVRLDRDTATSATRLDEALGRIRSGEADIVIGTQMVAKGHDFPRLTLVGVVNVDQGLFSHDFRATEHMLQQLVQVTGRAGRAELAGDVLLQTAWPAHPCFDLISSHDYPGFVTWAMSEREATGFPPFSHLAMIRCEAATREAAMTFLYSIHKLAQRILEASDASVRDHVRLMDPVPSPMERRAGRYRTQLLTVGAERGALHAFLDAWLAQFTESSAVRKVRWSLDVDPTDLY